MFATLQLFTVAYALLVARGAEAQAANCARNFTVGFQETCNSIAADQGVSTYQLQSVNNATVDAFCGNLVPGTQICLALVGQDCQPVHVVEDGDTCSGVAAAAGTTVGTLIVNNPNLGVDCTVLYPGLVRRLF